MIPAGDSADHRLIKAEPKTLIWSEPLASGGRAVVKMYRRKSFYDPARRWLVPYRVEREFELLTHLHRHAVPCAEPLWWSHGRNRANGRHELLATREIEGAVPLAELLSGTATRPDLAALFRLARRMHECGISHGAFYPTNVLALMPPGAPPACYLIDMAHGCRFTGSIVGTRPAVFDLLDMLRAIERRRLLDGCATWIAGYGLGADQIELLMRKLHGHRLERPWRHLHRIETDARAAWDRITRPAASRA